MIELSNPMLRIAIRPDLGGALASCDIHIDGHWHPLMRRAHDSMFFNDMACYVLAPWGNRIEAGAFAFAEARHQIRTDWPDRTAIHGDVKMARCGVLDRSPQSVRLCCDRRGDESRNWPWAYSTTIRYQINDASLAIDLHLTNHSAKPMPAGLGLHPFFMSSINGSPPASITLNVRGRYPCTDMLPTAVAAADALTQSLRAAWQVKEGLDDVFALDDAFDSTIEWQDTLRLRLTSSAIARHAVIYTVNAPDPPFFCLEPATHVNNAINLAARGWNDTGLVTLPAGETLHMHTQLDCAPVCPRR